MQWGCLPPARRSLPVLSSYAIAGHFHNDFALKAARAKQGAQGWPGNGAGCWGPRGRRPGDTAESAVGLRSPRERRMRIPAASSG